MKKLFYTLFSAAVLLSCTGTPKSVNDTASGAAADTGKAVIAFSEYEHHFGQVKAGKTARHTFTFENTGTGNLVIQSAMTTCGCTVPRYNKRPVAPGKSGTLDVEFDTSGRNGMQAKTITIKSNASVPAVILKITADVI